MMVQTVEIALNLIWCLLVAAGFAVWLRLGRRKSTSRCIQFIAICSLAFILFPVISLTDDLWAMHNPAEVDTSLRRSDTTAHLRMIVPEMPSVRTEELTVTPAVITAYIQVAEFAPCFFAEPLRGPLFSRPPPAA